ncbi:xaa-Pro aminopeptidase 2 isoform X1 [Electrophorus electricus]|uniref:xaa-Pro aminopeptidase 2 isoform X1 n=2 Tax=Electrophorus electricus TaxID=8005 RepID=UPI0015D0B5D1|nr:xaa-Pro aminopeptidase 2 isoform X1 [Electrophorus electricus]
MTVSGWIVALFLVTLTGVEQVLLSEWGSETERNCSAVPPFLPPTAVNTSLRLQELRADMTAHNITAYIIPGTDAHMSEYIAARDARLAWMSGFTGSAGTAVVTQDRAVLWTDSRYWVQAARQMDCNWEMERDVSISSITSWLIREVKEGDQVGLDPFLFSVDTFAAYSASLSPAKRILKSVLDNLVDKIWTERPPVRADNLTRLPDSFIERTWQMKVEQIRGQMLENIYQPSALLLSALDETAWLFNMRGNDIPFNPFFFSYTLLTLDQIWLFVHTERVTPELQEYLKASCNASLCVQLLDYNLVHAHLQMYLEGADVRVWVGTKYTNQALYELLTPERKRLQSAYSPVLTTKAVKDSTEQINLREAHIRDAVAVMQLLHRLESSVPEGSETEVTAAKFVDEYRSMQRYSRGPSFETISASGPNAALAHYSPSKETARKLSVDEMYLLDSGGQYLDGTTDITRTVHWGTPTAFQKEAFTRVLMGNIEISRTKFPTWSRGVNIEMLGRRALWEVGLNYGHGTGHGVGNYFGVHEWPVGFQSDNIPFLEGMFTSIEPGYYKENEFGIRIEDVAVTVPAQTTYGSSYLTFETVSLVPYDRKLINTSMLSPEQLQWLNTYYQTIRAKMGPALMGQGLTEVHDWMIKNTEPFLTAGAPVLLTSVSMLLLFLTPALL